MATPFILEKQMSDSTHLEERRVAFHVGAFLLAHEPFVPFEISQSGGPSYCNLDASLLCQLSHLAVERQPRKKYRKRQAKPVCTARVAMAI